VCCILDYKVSLRETGNLLYKYTIGQDLKRDALVLVRGVNRVNKSNDKAQHFGQLLDDNPSIQGIMTYSIYYKSAI